MTKPSLFSLLLLLNAWISDTEHIDRFMERVWHEMGEPSFDELPDLIKAEMAQVGETDGRVRDGEESK